MYKLAILLSFLLMAGSIMPFFPMVHAADVATISDAFSGESLDDGSFIYVDLTVNPLPTINLNVDHPPGSDVDVVGLDQLPGAVLDCSLGAACAFSWSIDTVSDDIAVPATYGVTFNTTAATGTVPELKTILVSIMNGAPPITITFDRTGYELSSIARITINDTLANLNDLEKDEIIADITIVGGSPAPAIALRESDVPGQFVIDYPVPSSGNFIKVNYKSHEAKVPIGRSISMDNSKYYMDDQVTLQVIDVSKHGVGTLNTKVWTTSSLVKKTLSLIEDGNAGVFEGTFKISDVGAIVGDTITATYGASQQVEARVIQQEFKFGQESYGNNSYATITIVDKGLNVDKTIKDIVEVQITGHNLAAKSFRLIESGNDTAEFHTYAMPLITDKEALSEVNDYALYVLNGEDMTARYDGMQEPATARAEFDIPAAAANFAPGTPGPETPGVDAQIVFPGITMIDCGGQDSDKDGLCNGWESGGFLKIPYPDPSGTPFSFSDSCVPSCPSSTKKDVYLEVDYDGNYYTSTGLTTALNDVKTKFAAAPVSDSAGIVLHYKVNDRILNIPSPGSVRIWSDSPNNPTPTLKDSYTELKHDYFGTTSDVKSWTPPTNKKYAYVQVNHYALVIKQQTDAVGSSGISEIAGDDVVISLAGSFGVSVAKLEGTIMHELGHNLGLNHGGGIAYASYPPNPGAPETYTWVADNNVNCKPNYPSVMSYQRQFSYEAFSGNTLDYSAGLINNPNGINYKHLYETAGLKPDSGSVGIAYGINEPGNPGHRIPNPSPVTVSTTQWGVDWQWDNNGIPDGDSNLNNLVTDTGVFGCNVANNPVPDPDIPPYILLKDYDDWDHLIMNYRYYNPASLSTGFRVAPAADLSDFGWDDIKKLSVTAIDTSIQQLDNKISGPSNSSSVPPHDPGIDFSRTTLPIPPQVGSATADLIGSNKVISTLIVTDTDQNNDTDSEDSFPFEFGMNPGQFTVDVKGDDIDVTIYADSNYTGSACIEFKATCLDDILPDLPDLDETGKVTGVFESELGFVKGGLDLTYWKNLQITFNYHNATGDKRSATVLFNSFDGAVAVDQTSAKPNTMLTMIIEDYDLNLDDDEVEEFEGSIVVNNDALLTVETKDDTVGGVDTETFEETGQDTGIFQAEYRVSTDIPISDGGLTATSILITYNDEITAAGGKDRIEVVVPVVSNTGSVVVSPRTAYPTTTLTVFIADSDLDQNHNEIDSYDTPDPDDDDFFVSFRSDRSEVGVASPNIEETGPSTGVFEFTIELITDGQACEDDDLSDAQFEAQGGSDPSIGVCPDDLLSIKYEDDEDGSGQQVTVSRVIQIKPTLEDFQDEAHDILMTGVNGMPSVYENVQGNDMTAIEQAVEQLKSLRALLDGSVGGDPSNDHLDEINQREVIPILDNTLTMLELVELNAPYELGHKMFALNSYSNSKVYTIGVEAETVSPVIGNFANDIVSKELRLKLIGQGDFLVTIPNDLASDITKVTISGEQLDFEETASNTTHTTYLVENLSHDVGLLSLSYAPPPPPHGFPVSLTMPTVKDTGGSTLLDVIADRQVMLTTTAKNELANAQPVVVLIEVMDSDGVTIFLSWTTMKLSARGESEVGISWTPNSSGTYEIRAFALSSLSNPQVLSEVKSATIVVVDRPSDGGNIAP